MEGEPENHFVVATHGVVNFGVEIAVGAENGIDSYTLRRWKGQVLGTILQKRNVRRRRQRYCHPTAHIGSNHSEWRDFNGRIAPNYVRGKGRQNALMAEIGGRRRGIRLVVT